MALCNNTLLRWEIRADNFQKKSPPDHPIADALCEALHSSSLNPDLLRSLVDCRIKDLHTKQPEKITDLEQYAEGTQGAILQLAVSSLCTRFVSV